MPHNHISAHRKHWALTPKEFGALTGVTADEVLAYEDGHAVADLDLLLTLEALFGMPARAFFPRQYGEIERAAIGRAAALSIQLEGHDDLLAETKRTLLNLMADRADSHDAA